MAGSGSGSDFDIDSFIRNFLAEEVGPLPAESPDDVQRFLQDAARMPKGVFRPEFSRQDETFQELIDVQAEYAFDPVRWAEDICGFKADKWQREALEDLIEKRFCAWSAGSGVGKTALLAIAIWFFISTRPFPRIPCTAPSSHQLYDVLWAELAKWQAKSPFLRKYFVQTKRRIELIGCGEQWFAVATTGRTSSKEKTAAVEGLQGFHQDNILFVVDEACYHPNTLISTNMGWKPIGELTADMLIRTKVPGGKHEFYVKLKPKSYHTYTFNGELYNFRSKHIDITVTPDHMMYASIGGLDNFKLIKAEDLANIGLSNIFHLDLGGGTCITMSGRSVSTVAYNGPVYCVTVPTSLVFVAGKGSGAPLWCGNSGVPDQVMVAVEGSLTTSGAHAVLASNPTRRSGFFYNIITNPKFHKFWSVKFISAEKAEHADKAEIHRVRETYGRNSDYYRVKVLGLPPQSDNSTLVTPEAMYEAHQRSYQGIGEEDGNPIKNLFIGCDPARYGGDNTVIYIAKGFTVIDRRELSQHNNVEVAKYLLELVKAYRPTAVFIDEIGLGGGVVDALHEMLKTDPSLSMFAKCVKGIHVGAASKNNQFANIRAQLYFNMQTFITTVAIPLDTPLLDEELTSITYKWDVNDRRIRIMQKDVLRSMLGRSPNDADAFVLTFSPYLLDEYKSPSVTIISPSKGEIVTMDDADESRRVIGRNRSGNSGILGTTPILTSSGGRVGRKRYADLYR